uniref:HTH psq-type domain-containing protein n=1 Tax=Globisporangium ultimum (strain ATCC 200006 / CBS 805.95 / DAOM BR144) TaxID=431595 RepID=K3X4L9_GLOUD
MSHAQQEALAAVVEAVCSKQMSVRAAAAAFGVNRGSLYRRASGQVELSARNGPAPVLTDGEVRKVLEAVRDRAERGERMANAELAAFVRAVVGKSLYQRDMPAHFPSMRLDN